MEQKEVAFATKRQLFSQQVDITEVKVIPYIKLISRIFQELLGGGIIEKLLSRGDQARVELWKNKSFEFFLVMEEKNQNSA